MPDDTIRFTPEQLDRIEQELWKLIDTYSVAEEYQFPPVESLLGPGEACELYDEALHLYATAIIKNREAEWNNHPVVEHLTTCTHCLKKLNHILASHEGKVIPARRLGADVDITIFDQHLTGEENVLRSAIDPRRPELLSSGFLEQPSDWYYSLESLPQPNDLRPNIRLTLTAPEDTPANVPVTLVLFGQILQGTTNVRGEVEFKPEIVPLMDDPQIPILNVHVHLSELNIA
jgi:hypothetical protein